VARPACRPDCTPGCLPACLPANQDAIEKYGLGTGYRTLSGTHALHVELEEQIAHFKVFGGAAFVCGGGGGGGGG
jgi:7-keto-8-aminopelargonate synthetase-like enzyme